MTTRRVGLRRIESAINTLADLTTEDLPELDGRTRDDISQIINTLEQVVERRRPGSGRGHQ